MKENVIIISYKIIDNLFYFDDDERNLRFCILIIIKVEIFKLIYDEIKHFDYARIYKRFIKKLYIFNITTKFYKFIRYYFHYQLNQISHYKSYDFYNQFSRLLNHFTR